jgi:ABC-type uncharacterized transport system permease subunit
VQFCLSGHPIGDLFGGTIGILGEGALGQGVAVIARGYNPLLATLAGIVAGGIAGLVTGLLHTRLKLKTLLAGILTSTALYSVILYILGGGDLSIGGKPTVYRIADGLLAPLLPQQSIVLFGTTVSRDSIATLILLAGIALFLGSCSISSSAPMLGWRCGRQVTTQTWKCAGIDVGRSRCSAWCWRTR